MRGERASEREGRVTSNTYRKWSFVKPIPQNASCNALALLGKQECHLVQFLRRVYGNSITIQRQRNYPNTKGSHSASATHANQHPGKCPCYQDTVTYPQGNRRPAGTSSTHTQPTRHQHRDRYYVYNCNQHHHH
ncbi:hypothetical protein BaRGS_00036724 [Batillaria attramentaria]|uniref:Uncharacterized protein n=1 Tax=Batillaria attramentaria TaxID=370345 RepID=A0ABD0JBA3_9CAEN